MPAIIATVALLFLPLVGWEHRRRGSRRALRVWAWTSPPVAVLAIAVIALWVMGTSLASDLLSVLGVAVAAVCAATTLATRSDERG